MTQEEYKNTQTVLEEFPGYEEKYKRSALFHQVVQMLARGVSPYKVIEALITTTEDTQKAFENYMITDTRPLRFNP